ncbi:MAG: hypothetical protein IKH39_00690 [Candidatus Methanomethylophilaceae archaeon]|nr:hypothetical protein [Candidatus Methanomethylophilaceae archaeon]
MSSDRLCRGTSGRTVVVAKKGDPCPQGSRSCSIYSVSCKVQKAGRLGQILDGEGRVVGSWGDATITPKARIEVFRCGFSAGGLGWSATLRRWSTGSMVISLHAPELFIELDDSEEEFWIVYDVYVRACEAALDVLRSNGWEVALGKIDIGISEPDHHPAIDTAAGRNPGCSDKSKGASRWHRGGRVGSPEGPARFVNGLSSNQGPAVGRLRRQASLT